jgi:hypothetical protein
MFGKFEKDSAGGKWGIYGMRNTAQRLRHIVFSAK